MADVMILAAGLGTRMKSRRAKVLHELAGRPLVAHVLSAALHLAPRSVLTVVGHQAADVEAAVRDAAARLARPGAALPELLFVTQTEQRGTGHAVMAAREALAGLEGPLVVLAGDVPLIQGETLQKLVEAHVHDHTDASLLAVWMEEPTGYGRVVFDSEGRFERIVEEKDATPEERAIQEVNVSIYCFEIAALLEALDELKNDNAQGEYYLTDVPHILAARGRRVGIVKHQNASEVAGINTRIELAALERKMREEKLRELMLSGVTVVDPATTYIHAEVEIAPDTIIQPQVIIEGASRIGAGCEIQSWTRLRDVVVEDGVKIKNSCVIEESVIRAGASVGPFARLRGGAEIGEEAAIGNFVEVKKSRVGRRTKASHLTYLGDATLGERVNIGAGTVTCNYDGVRKHETVIEDDVKIGSDTMLVAPVRVGRGSKTGAGAVVTRDVPPDSLAVGVPAVIKDKKA